MKKNELTTNAKDNRRQFIKKVSMGLLATSAYTVFSMTVFSCKKDSDPGNNGGY